MPSFRMTTFVRRWQVPVVLIALVLAASFPFSRPLAADAHDSGNRQPDQVNSTAGYVRIRLQQGRPIIDGVLTRRLVADMVRSMPDPVASSRYVGVKPKLVILDEPDTPEHATVLSSDYPLPKFRVRADYGESITASAIPSGARHIPVKSSSPERESMAVYIVFVY